MEEKSKVSVIIPIYGVEKFIVRCAESLFLQTLREIEFIFVDDATPDKSIDLLKSVIKRFPERKDQVRIVVHKENKGLPAARNTGLAVATGEYVFHCDSDDYVEKDMLEVLYKQARFSDADVVWCDWFLSYEKTERYMRQPDFKTSEDALKGMLSDSMKYNVWNKLVKRDVYVENCIEFPSGHSMGEDMTMIRVMACSERVVYVSNAFYHYVKTNADAMTQSLNKRHLADIRYNVDLTLNFLDSHRCVDLEKEKAFFKLNVKLPFLITSDWNSYKKWNSWYPEANKFIMQNKQLALRTRLLQWMAAKKCYVIVWLYFIVVYGFLYNILYKR